ncbi:MAG: tRNA uridine-5-carboxymethylaminomethyl(34) synthesis GTPase MnmE [Lachnospiraceae bacterium]|nr:tRNA uridine-5-carboxymethylaminomethyl(34) synthesis GTPase MnmE [Lachnospiraceae bacterium]
MTSIAAISTPSGIGGIAVLRLSGPDAYSIAARHLKLQTPDGPRPVAAYALFRVGDAVLDEVVVTCYRAPHSYTGEDMVEISCHGSIYVQQTILQALLDSGATLAEPGEFTRRAFLNGKLDLSQAEAVADLIDATDAGSHQLAISQLRGGYAQRLKELRDQFVELTSLLELELDFSEEDVEFADRSQLVALLDAIEKESKRLVDSFSLGNAIKNGVPVAIAGRPNVGKSTLLNALVGEERAIVSDIAGTTRDTIEDTLTIGGITFRFIDTAGIRHSDDTIESLGIERSYRAIEQAQVVLYLTDAAHADTLPQELADLQSHVDLTGKTLLPLINKIDSAAPPTGSRPNSQFSILNSQFSIPPTGSRPILDSQFSILNSLPLSAKTGAGLDQLRQRLADLHSVPTADQPILSNLRHYHALQQVLESTAQVRQGLLGGLPADLVVIDLREALYHLGTITGQVSSDEILGSIFHRFCIGK